jgi:hypothetical protein
VAEVQTFDYAPKIPGIMIGDIVAFLGLNTKALAARTAGALIRE